MKTINLLGIRDLWSNVPKCSLIITCPDSRVGTVGFVWLKPHTSSASTDTGTSCLVEADRSARASSEVGRLAAGHPDGGSPGLYEKRGAAKA